MNNNICLILITDGRKQYIKKTINSFTKNLKGDFDSILIIDDSADDKYASWLDGECQRFQDYQIIHHQKRRGFCGAIMSAYDSLPDHIEWIFHLEDDFVLTRAVKLSSLLMVLAANPHLAQMALLRQAWNNVERKAGGIIQANPEAYIQKETNGLDWIEHSLFWTTNPSLYSREILLTGWYDEPECEGKFGLRLKEIGYKFGFWGCLNDDPLVHHIGAKRVGTNY